MPFSKTLFGMMAITVDVFLRALTQAYFMTFLKEYVLLIPLFYFLIMFTFIFIARGKNIFSGYTGY